MKRRAPGAGSDVPVTPMTPWWGVWSAVVRRELTRGEILAPEERLSIPEALTLYTRNGAYIGFEEKSKGSLEPGKLADFIVVDRDVLKVPNEELKDVQVIMTFVGGGLSYKKTQQQRRIRFGSVFRLRFCFPIFYSGHETASRCIESLDTIL